MPIIATIMAVTAVAGTAMAAAQTVDQGIQRASASRHNQLAADVQARNWQDDLTIQRKVDNLTQGQTPNARRVNQKINTEIGAIKTQQGNRNKLLAKATPS